MQAFIYRGSDFEIHTARRTLSRGGATIECEPRVFDLIVLLVEQRDRAVDKQELITTLWNGRPVSDASLSQLVYKARKALGDHGDAQACIRTVHGRGFRWVAPITALAPAETAPAALERPGAGAAHASVGGATPAWRRPRPRLVWALAALVLLACAGAWHLAKRPGIAAASARVLVLPAELDAGLEELDWTRLGIMGLVATTLDADAGIATVDLATARRYAATTPSTPAQRRAWRETTGARHSLALHLRRAGPLLQLDAVLDGADGERRRSLFGEDPGQLALDMGGVVRDWLDPRPRAPASAGDLSGETASTYALGVDAVLRGDFDAARRYFALCIERSPDALQPRLQLALVELKFADAQRAAERVDEVLARVDAARQPRQALDALRLLGYVELQRGRLDAAQAAFTRARALLDHGSPSQRAGVFVGEAQLASRSGRYAEAAAAFEQARALYAAAGDAIGESSAWNNIGVLERLRGRTAASEAALLRSLAIARERDVPWQQSLTVANLVQLRVGERRFREAVRLGEAALAPLQPPAPRDRQAERVLLLELASARLHLGQAGPARDYATRALALAVEHSDPGQAAIARVLLAQADVALEQPGALARYREAIEACERTGQWQRAAHHAARLAYLQRRAGDLAGLRESVARSQRIAGAAATPDLDAHAVAALAQLDAAEGRATQALQRLLALRRDALRAGDRIGAQRAGLDYVALAIDLGEGDLAGAVLAELDATNDSEGDGLVIAELWHRARGDDAGAEALRLRREQLDAALPPPTLTGAGTESGA